MSGRDIRSFFKPLSKATPSNSNSKQQTSSTSTKPVNSSKNVKSPKAKKTEKKEPKKLEIVSSDSDDDIKPKSKTETKSSSKKSPRNTKKDKKEVRKIEKLSSDSEDDVPKSHSKTRKNANESKVNLKKLTAPNKSDNDEDDDVIDSTPVKPKRKKALHVLSSDEDEKPQPKVARTKEKASENLKPVAINDIFGKTVKQSKVETVKQSKEETVKPKVTEKRKRNKKETEIGIHEDADFEKTLIDLDNDDDIFIQNEDILNKTIESAMENYASEAKDESKSEKSVSTPKQEKNTRKRTLEKESIDKDDTPSKKTKLVHVDSGIDDQERYEKKKYCAMQYQQYLNRGAPKNQGCKEYPKGKPDCLANLCFMKTGVLDSLDSEEFKDLIQRHGGRTVVAVSKKVNYVVVGEDPGPAKIEKAKSYNLPMIDEDELLDMILQKSGLPKKYTLSQTSSFNDAGIDTSFQSSSGSEKLSENKESKSKRSEKPLKIEETEAKPKIHEQDNKKQKQRSPVKKSTEIKVKSEIKVKEETDQSELVIEKPNLNSVCLSEKYKPMELKQIVGQQMNNSNMNKLKKWLEAWHDNEKLRKNKKIPQPSPWNKNHDGEYYKCALLSGAPGVGKTTTATLVAKSLGYEIVEFNASDTRSKNLLKQEIASALTTKNISFFNKADDNKIKRVILMDEVDGMAGNEDRGGMQELINLIKQTKIPIICMCNDRNHQKMRSLSNYCFDLRFEKPKAQQILGFVMSICCKEGLKVTPQIVMEIINGTTCDIRQTLNQISMIANLDDGITLEQAQKDSVSAKKDTVLGPWQVCKMVFNEADQKNMSFRDKSRLFFYDYSMGPLFVQENYLKVQPNVPRKKTMKQVAASAEAISMGATIDQKIRTSNNWSLLDTQAIFSSVLPGHYMSGNFTAGIDFPGFLGKFSKKNKHKRLINELSSHTRLKTSGGSLAMNLDYSKTLLTSIITPLKEKGLGGVSEAVEIMKSYQLLRVDLDSLIEICTWPKQKNVMSGVETNVKTAFTRLYNKEVPMFSYSVNDAVSKKRAAALYDDELNEGETEQLSETEDKIEDDNAIKIKTKSKTQNKKDSSKPSTSKSSTSKQRAKPKGKAKK